MERQSRESTVERWPRRWQCYVANLVTFSVLLTGCESILNCLEGRFVLAAQLIILAALLDGLDGEVARSLRAVTMFGARLDTYVDTVSFGVAPAVLVYRAVLDGAGWWSGFVAFGIVLAGVLRFSRMLSKSSPMQRHAYRGLPIPVSAVWIAVFVLLQETDMAGAARPLLVEGPLHIVMWIITVVLLLLQLSRIRYAKPTRGPVMLGVVATVVLMVVLRNPALVLCVATCVGLLFYTLVFPFLYRERVAEEDWEQEQPAIP